MRKLLPILLLLSIITFGAGTASAATECAAGATRDAFIQAAKEIPVKIIYTLTKPAVKLWLKAMSDNSGQVWEADEIMFAPLPGGDDIGVVLIKDGCVVIGTVKRIPSQILVQFLSDAGIKPTDIVKLSEA